MFAVREFGAGLEGAAMTPYYQDDWATIYHGDCREVLPKLEGVDLVLTDPPYGISLQPPRGLTDAIQGDGRDEAKQLLSTLLRWMAIHTLSNSAHFIFAGWSEDWVPRMIREWFTVKACIVWKKNVWGIGYHTRPQHEFIYLVHHGSPEPPEEPCSDVWEFPRSSAPIHSCEKPVKLLSQAIQLYDTARFILDPFMGSGTTLRAAKDLNRQAIGIEIEEKYCEIAANRMSQEVLDFT